MSNRYPVGSWTGWQGFALWKDKVDNELVEIRERIDVIAAILNESGVSGGTSGPNAGSGSGGPTQSGSDFSSVKDYITDMEAIGPYAELLRKIPDIEEEQTEQSSMEGLINATYAFHTATHAMRGYLMLIDQLGLNKDQKKMVRDLEYVMMAMMKLTMALSMIGEMMAGTLQPELLPLFLIGGLISASVGYSSKVVGSGV